MTQSGRPSPFKGSGVQKYSSKILTFDGVNFGTPGTIPIFNVTAGGVIWIRAFAARCPLTLVGAGATIALGFAGNTGGLIAATDVTTLLTGSLWLSSTPVIGVGNVITNMFCTANVIATIAGATVTAGELEFHAYWQPFWEQRDGLS